MADLHIKPDPDAPRPGASPAAMSEDDIYEDAGDLEFNRDPRFQSLYLAKLPPFVWQAWSKLDDDAEIEIGTIRRSVLQQPNGAKKETLFMKLHQQAQHQTVPKEYQLEVLPPTRNTFVFTEKDLPGYKSKSSEKFDPATANMPTRLLRAKNEKQDPSKPFDPKKRFQPYQKIIPKRTTLAGRVLHEVNTIIVHNEESQRILSERTLEAMKPKHRTAYINQDDLTTKGLIQPGMVASQGQWGTFVRNSGTTAGKRPQLQKTARMPQNELLDKIFECFKRYNYWSMKALRAELQQPEAYLRETLERVAVLAKSGRFATQWSLKPENKMSNYEAMGDAAAPTEGLDDSEFGDDDDDDDDPDVKFEDVA